ncbi:MAG: hypothetical protein FWE22_08345 [Firmicutes bacterium]|nr:hypothetical protein [Bacillota bacterium]
MKIEFYVSDGDDIYYADLPVKTLEEAADYLAGRKWIYAATGRYNCIVFTNTITSIYNA